MKSGWGRHSRVVISVAVLGSSVPLAGCGSMIADLPVVGLPANAPPRSTESRAFLPVHDVPADRDTATMSAADQAKLQAELLAARDRQAAAAAAK